MCISIHNTKIKHGFLKFYELCTYVSQFRVHFISFQEFLLVNLHIFHTISCKITILMVRQSTITM